MIEVRLTIDELFGELAALGNNTGKLQATHLVAGVMAMKKLLALMDAYALEAAGEDNAK